MNADAFLALVRKHRPELEAFGEPIFYASTCVADADRHQAQVLTRDESEELADSAPALAAAAIRVLRIAPWAHTPEYDDKRHAATAADYIAALQALEAALPESLRP